MKKFIISAIIIITISVVYYFVFFLPKQEQMQLEKEKQALLFNKKTECKNICETLYNDDKNSLDSVLNPHYTYNAEKNACFYSGGYLMDTDLTKRVVNCQTNEEVLTFMTNKIFSDQSICPTCVNSLDEYDEREKELMEE